MLPTFFEDVWDVVRMIPPGRVTSYGTIARFLGRGTARMVGWAMNHCHGFDDVPAHRVVNSSGILSGKAHFSPPESMQQRLEAEGIEVKNDKIVNFPVLFWDPMKEIQI